jgi:hypothetical protein
VAGGTPASSLIPAPACDVGERAMPVGSVLVLCRVEDGLGTPVGPGLPSGLRAPGAAVARLACINERLEQVPCRLAFP